MRWFERHLDELLANFPQGNLSASRSSKVLRHVHCCHPCAKRYERWVTLSRMLEHGSLDQPTKMELAILEAAGLSVALAASERSSLRRGWISWAAFAGSLATTAAISFLWIQPHQKEWVSRGNPDAARAVIRVFCALKGQPIRELRMGQACPVGASLAFAVGAEPSLPYVGVRLRSGNRTIFEGPCAITARPGAEVPLTTTLPLDLPVGEAEMIAVFAAEPTKTKAEPKEDGKRHDQVILRQKLWIGPAE